jgi:hypothetical protein
LYFNLISNPSYEVRLLGFREMKNSMNSDFPTWQGSNVRQHHGNILKENELDGDIVMASDMILDKFISMALGEEQHPECLTHVSKIVHQQKNSFVYQKTDGSEIMRLVSVGLQFLW